MPLLETFARNADLAAQTELERVRRLVYFFTVINSQPEVSLAEVLSALRALHLPQPNVSRLRGNMTPSSGFVRATSRDAAKLHFKKLREYEDLFPELRKPDIGASYKAGGLQGLFVSKSRIDELSNISNQQFDLRKLLALLEELNINAAAQCYLSVAMLIRAVIDHVPPIFGFHTFNEVANSAPGSKSFKDSMKHLNDGARKIADAHLHVQIRQHEVLPNERQIDFSQSMDVLLAEIVRVLR